MQNTSVLAMGVKYFPSIPFNVRMGKKTIRIINTAKVAERATPEAPFSTSLSISLRVSVRPRNCFSVNVGEDTFQYNDRAIYYNTKVNGTETH